MIFEWDGEQYNNEQEIIEAGCYVIYWYCCDVRGRWIDIEHLMIKSGFYGYVYALDVMEERYEPELEILYLMRYSGYWVKLYIDEFVRYGNV